MNEKLVSVIIPFFNQTQWLLEAIESVKKQTYSNWELILVNDGSTDDISKIQSLIKKESRFQLIEQQNAGIASARNAGIAASKGYYIALLDANDMWDSHKLEAQITYMEQNGYLVSHTCYTLSGDDGITNEIYTGAMEGKILKKLIVSCPLSISSVVVAKSLVSNLNPPFRTEYQYGEDICFLISISSHTSIGAVKEFLTFVRPKKEIDDLKKSRIIFVNILSFMLQDSNFSILDSEINIISKKIAQITKTITKRQERQSKLGKKLKALESIRQNIKNEFEKKHFFPKVSIIIPVYNGANYMCDAIESALTQTYENIEIIVVNDGSTDDGETAHLAQIYGSNIRYFAKTNGGVATALNLGIERMEGEYFSWLSHDDMYTPKKIEEEVRALADLTDHTTIIAEGYQVINSFGKYLYTVNIHNLYSSEQLKNSLFLLMRGGINGCGLLIHKSHFERVGLFNPQLPTTQDYDLWFRMFRNQSVHFLDSSNVLSRSHEEQGSKALLEDHVKECDRLWIRMMNELTLSEKNEISGSEYTFYHDLWKYLRTSSGYQGAITYAHKKMILTAITAYERSKGEEYLAIIADLCGVTPEFAEKELLPLYRSKQNKPRLIFQLSYRNPKGGLNRMVVENANMFSDKYDVIIYTCGQPYDSGYGYPSCASVKELAIDHSKGQTEKHLNVLLLLRADIYIYSYCCCKETLPLLEQVKQLGIKTIAWSHEDYFLPYWRESLRDSIAPRKEFLPKADAVVWLNTSSQALYGMRYTNGICIPNPSRNRTSLTIPSIRGNILVAAGRFDDSRKGLGDLLQIFSYIHKRRPDAELYIVGLVDLQLPVSCMSEITCREFIAKEGLTDQYLHLIDWTEDIDRYYQLGALHIMPSLYEGFGLVVLEAAANGTPTIAYSGSGMQDIIISNQDGVVTECGDWKKMAEATLDLLDHPDKLESMQKKLPDLLERYSQHTIYEKWERLFTSLLSNDSGALETYFKSEQTELTPGMAKKTLEELDKLGIIADRQIEIREKVVIQENTNILEEPGWKECYMNVLNSKSWKLTAPLRFIMGLFKNDNPSQ